MRKKVPLSLSVIPALGFISRSPTTWARRGVAGNKAESILYIPQIQIDGSCRVRGTVAGSSDLGKRDAKACNHLRILITSIQIA